MLKIVFVLILLFKFSISANILLFYCAYGKSHLFSFLPLMQQLGKDGHNVTVFHIDNTPPPNMGYNISVIDVNIDSIQNDVTMWMQMLWTKTAHGFLLPIMYNSQSKTFNDFVVESNGTYSEVFNRQFDLVVVDELFTQHGIVAASILKSQKNIPHIIFSPTVQTYWYQSKIALSRNYVSADSLMGPIPSKSTDFYQPSKFVDRLIAFSENYIEVFLMDWLVMPTAPYFLPGVNMERHYRDAYFTFGEHIDRLGNPMTEGSDLFLVGSNCKSASAVLNATLPKEWKEFIEDPKSQGTIYIAFGSALLWDYMSPLIKDTFIAAVNKLNQYRIIFSWNGKFPKTVGTHVKFTKWAPQMAILSHPKTKVFLTHGGLKSLKESLCAEIPIVLMPLLAEQVYNAKFCLKLGMGLVLNKYEINAEKIATTLREVAVNDAYQQKVKKLKAMYLDRPMDASKYGSFRITKFLNERQKFGSEMYDSAHDNLLRRKGRLLNILQFCGFDFVFVIFAFIYIFSK